MSKSRKLFLIAGALLSFVAAPQMVAQTSTAFTAENRVVTQNFNSMWDNDLQEATLSLPEGWKIERQMTAPRTLGSYANASAEVMYTGSTNLPSNAKNGTWNFGSSSDSQDRAIGGLTTTVANGTRCVNVMTHLQNLSSLSIDKLTISYNIEKYRKGANTAGFAVQLYTSADGTNWTSAGEDFYTLFAPDGETLGADIVPITVTSITAKSLLANIEAGGEIYLAWNISVASGSSPDKAPGLALDDVEIEATFNDPSVVKHKILIEDCTKWDALALYATDNSFGAYPGQSPAGNMAVNGVNYKVFEFTATPVEVKLNNTAGTDLNAVSITENRDYYFCATSTEIAEIPDPEHYTGWVDPDAPVFVPSGIYLRGDVNSWGADASWEFSDEGDGHYVLYNKNLSGAFKVADASWSSNCNYGSNGSTILPDRDYQLVKGTNDNISCGANAYTCTEIRLTLTDDNAVLYLKSNDDPTGLTTVYVIGDNNNWNYMDPSGALKLDATDNLFKGKISMPKSSADELSHWRIYQRLGMGGSWGAPDGVDMTESTHSGTLEKGSTANAAVAPGTYSITFDLATGAYNFVKESAAIADMVVSPEEVVLVQELPETVKVLSLNNSLIYYNDQDAVFNGIASSMGKDASWTKHTLLGKSLQTHWDEGEGLAADGTPSAKMMVRSDAWSHIILQEQSSLPRTNPAQFLASVKQWIGYIRENCPNPNAIVIIPMNWAYGSDWENFKEFNAQFSRNYQDVAGRTGVIVCPVATAYEAIFENEGAEGAAKLFLDDRHPTAKATYLAACMEYSLIFGEDALTINSHPSTITDEEAASMRNYASSTMAGFSNYVNHHDGTIAYSARLFDEYGIEVEPETPITFNVNGGGTIDANNKFTSDGTLGDFTVSATNGQFTRTASIKVAKAETVVLTFPSIVLNEETLSAEENFDEIGNEAEATLPEAWRIDRQTVGPRTLGSFAMASEQTMYSGGVSLPSNAKNGIWNFGDTEGSDRALGGITTGVDNGTRAINLYVHLSNDGKKDIENLTVGYDVEKYRKGSNAAGFAVQLYYSLDGRNWISAGNEFHTYLNPDTETAGYAEVPGEVHPVSATLPTKLQRGCDLYLAWNISVASGDAAQSAMALAIDNFTISGSLPEIPEARHYMYVDDQTGWDYLGVYAWGDSELFGAWPGESPIDEKEIDGRMLKVFALDAETGNYNLIFNNWNNGKQCNDYNITANRDYYFIVTETEVREFDPAGIETVETAKASFLNGILTAPGAEKITVYGVNGYVVASSIECSVDLRTLSRGVYIVAIEGENPCVMKVVR